MDTDKRVEISELNDTYGALLTSHQTEMIRLYYDLDVSLGEIAEQYDVSRQAVRDAIMRGEKALGEYEAKLHMVSKTRRLVDGLDAMATSHLEVRDEANALIDILEED